MLDLNVLPDPGVCIAYMCNVHCTYMHAYYIVSRDTILVENYFQIFPLRFLYIYVGIIYIHFIHGHIAHKSVYSFSYVKETLPHIVVYSKAYYTYTAKRQVRSNYALQLV